MDELAPVAIGNRRAAGQPVGGRPASGREVMGAEETIEDWKMYGEVPVDRLHLGGVVPVVEAREWPGASPSG